MKKAFHNKIKVLGLCTLMCISSCSKSEAVDSENEIITTPTPIQEPTDPNSNSNSTTPTGNYIQINPSVTYQTIDGFGAGIKRRTEDLYVLDASLREQVEAYCFRDLEVNMIRFFVYHDLEPENDNDDPFVLDESSLDWARYDSSPVTWKTRYVAEALQNAFNLSQNGFDHVIGNCNSAPPWLKTNGQHNGGGTLIAGEEEEFSEFLVAFLKGMKSRYGIDVTAISPTNEPDYEVSYESMNTTTPELTEILKNLDQRLTSEGLNAIDILSPECFRVSSANTNVSTLNYINRLFSDATVQDAIDIVGTHTYADREFTADWQGLKSASAQKPIWVTESANLRSQDHTMTDAANYIKWMVNGFNEGGMTAYMMHLFYEEVKEDGYSGLVAWTSDGQIALPKRYHTFKHFTNLVKKGYKLINSQIVRGNFWVTAFKAPDDSKIVLQIFNEGAEQEVSFDIPEGTESIQHYITSNAVGENFSLQSEINLVEGDQFFSTTMPSLSLHSFEFNRNP